MSTVKSYQLESAQEYSRRGKFGYERLEPVEGEEKPMQITKVFWFTDTRGCFGIVTGKDEVTGEKKAYIGHASGVSEDADAKYIAENGAKISRKQIEELYLEMEG